MRLHLLLLATALSVVGVAGCGGKSALHPPWTPRDGGPPRLDGGPLGRDAGPDAGPASPLVVDCGRSARFTTTGRTVTLEATMASPDAIVETGWGLRSSPSGSSAVNDPTEGPRTALSPDVLGDYALEFRARDAAGRTETCTVTVSAIVGPPVAICPEDALLAPVGTPLRLDGDAFDDVAVVSVSWRQLEGPSTSRITIVGGAGAIVDVVADVAGSYSFELRATDADGSADTCVVSARFTAPPVVMCPEMLSGPTRRPIAVHADASDESMIVQMLWELIAAPDGSTATLRPTSGEDTSITPDRRGEYLLRFTAIDDDGMSASCTTQVIGLPSPPDVTCPATIDTAPLSEATVTATAVDDGRIVTWRWRRASRPPGSAAGDPTPTDAATTQIRTDLAGEYVLEVTATDDDGMTDTCTTTVRAIASEGLRIEVSWNTDGTDMDTHLLSPIATRWFAEDDCYYGNCQGGGLSWFGPGPDDDPSLDIDDTNGFGPENINIERPRDGTYRVGIDAFSGAASVVVNIYCGGSTTTPRRTFGPVFITSSSDDLWRVADVAIAGSSCTITDLSVGGRPNIRGGSEGMR